MKRIHNNIVLVNKGDFESEDYQNKIAEFQYVFAEREDGKIRLCKARHNLTHAGDFLANVKDKEPAKAVFSPSVCSAWVDFDLDAQGQSSSYRIIKSKILQEAKSLREEADMLELVLDELPKDRNATYYAQVHKQAV